MSDRMLKRLFWTAGGALFVIGLVGWYTRVVHGLAPTHFGSIVTWGLWVGVYIYFIGLSAGSFLVSSLVYVFNVKRFEPIGRTALFTAAVTLMMALLVTLADIGHMERAWHVYVYPNFRSPMAWMLFLYTAYFVLILVELWLVMRRDLVVGARAGGFRGHFHKILSLGSKADSDESAARDRRIIRVLATIGVPVAILFHGGVGALFGVVAARPGWNSGLFPIMFLLSALTSGGALLLFVAAVFQDGWHRNRDTIVALGRLVLALLVADVILQASEMLVAAYGSVPGHLEPLKLIVSGPYWWVFWFWQIGVGTIVPILLLSMTRTRLNPRWVSAAGLLIALGFIGVRLNIVIPVMATEEVKGLGRAIASSRISTHYFPSSTEWLLAAGVLGLGLLLFGLGETLMPRAHTDEDDDQGLHHVPI